MGEKTSTHIVYDHFLHFPETGAFLLQILLELEDEGWIRLYNNIHQSEFFTQSSHHPTFFKKYSVTGHTVLFSSNFSTLCAIQSINQSINSLWKDTWDDWTREKEEKFHFFIFKPYIELFRIEHVPNHDDFLVFRSSSGQFVGPPVQQPKIRFKKSSQKFF